MKRNALITISLLFALLLAGLCSCKQEVSTETISEGLSAPVLNAGVAGVSIPKWEKQESGNQNLPDAVLSGTETGVSLALKTGLKNPPVLKKANNLIVMVCEGLRSDLIKQSAKELGELIIESFPVTGNIKSDFNSSDGDPLADFVRNDADMEFTGIVAYGNTATNSMRRMTTTKDNSETVRSVCDAQFKLNPSLKLVVGEGSFDASFDEGSPGYINEVYKSSGKLVKTLADAVDLYKNENVHFECGDLQHDGSVNKLYAIFDGKETLPSFRQEVAFSLAWMQNKVKENEEDGFCLLMSYSPATDLDANGVQDFDEGVAVAVKYALENPDTAVLVIGCPRDGSKADVCFYGFGKGVTVQNTAFECVSSLFN